MKDNCKLCVCCFTYNHINFINKALDGFIKQQTNFPFVCTIVDDASTDGEQELLLDYMINNFDLEDSSIVRRDNNNNFEMLYARHKQNHNCFFYLLLLKTNHYSVGKRKWSYISEWIDHAEYIAICEGDDYWFDPNKLQIQYDYMESHPECTMTCHRVQLFSEKNKKLVGEQYCRTSNGFLTPADIINRTGLYIPTCSIMYRAEIKKNYPDYCQNCVVGDYPLQITAAMKGTVYYYNRLMGVYRIDNNYSWAGRQVYNSIDPARLHIVKSQMEMFKGFSIDYPQYKKVYNEKILEHICRNMPSWRCKEEEVKKYLNTFSNEIQKFSFKGKFLMWVGQLRIPMLMILCRRLFFNNYFHKRKYY